MLDLIPLREEETRIKQEISRKHVVVFDSTTHLGEALAIVLRFVSDSVADLSLLLKVAASQLTGSKHLLHLVCCSSVLPLPGQCCCCSRKRSVL